MGLAIHTYNLMSTKKKKMLLYTISTKVGVAKWNLAIQLVESLVIISYITIVILSQWVIMFKLGVLCRP